MLERAAVQGRAGQRELAHGSDWAIAGVLLAYLMYIFAVCTNARRVVKPGVRASEALEEHALPARWKIFTFLL